MSLVQRLRTHSRSSADSPPQPRHAAWFEPLEDRRLFALLGLPPLAYPRIDTSGFDGSVNYTYNASTAVGSYDLSSSPFTVQNSPADPSMLVWGPKSFEIHFKTDGSGHVTGGVVGADFLITGAIDANNNFVQDPDETPVTLLSGEIKQFGFQYTGTGTDLYEFRFSVDSGSLAPSFTGADAGMTMSSENSTFTGDFAQDFSGTVGAGVGPIPPLTPAPPPAPTDLAADPALTSTTSANLLWSDNADDETGYEIDVSTDGVNYGYLDTAPANTTSYQALGLQPDTTYYFQVGAVNDAGITYATAGTSAHTQPLPATPQGLAVTARTANSISLTWNTTPANVADVDLSVIKDDQPYADYIVPAGQTTFTIHGLDPHTPYSFTLTAENNDGQSDPTPQTIALTLPAAPTAIQTFDEDGPLYITWQDNNDAAVPYDVVSVDNAGNKTVIATSYPGDTSITVPAPSAGNTLYLQADDADNPSGDGTGAFSDGGLSDAAAVQVNSHLNNQQTAWTVDGNAVADPSHITVSADGSLAGHVTGMPSHTELAIGYLINPSFGFGDDTPSGKRSIEVTVDGSYFGTMDYQYDATTRTYDLETSFLHNGIFPNTDGDATVVLQGIGWYPDERWQVNFPSVVPFSPTVAITSVTSIGTEGDSGDDFVSFDISRDDGFTYDSDLTVYLGRPFGPAVDSGRIDPSDVPSSVTIVSNAAKRRIEIPIHTDESTSDEQFWIPLLASDQYTLDTIGFVGMMQASATTKSLANPAVTVKTIKDNVVTGDLPSGQDAYVPVNSDDDNNDGKPDNSVAVKVVGEDDLLPIVLHAVVTPNGDAGAYRLAIPANLKVFWSTDRDPAAGPAGGNGEITNATTISANTDTIIYVEGASAGIGSLKVNWSNATVGKPNIAVIKIHVFDWSGPLDVPGHSIHQYTVGPGVPGMWITPFAGTLVTGANTSNVTIRWDGGPVIGKAIYQVNADYQWDMEVNVVEVKVEAPSVGNAFTPGTVTGAAPQAGLVADAHGNIVQVVKAVGPGGLGPGLVWRAKITLTGPNGDRGVSKIKVGFVQNVIGFANDGVYASGARLTSSLTGTITAAKPALDQAAGVVGPWYATNHMAPIAPGTPQINPAYFNASPTNKVQEIGAYDSPADGIPLFHALAGNLPPQPGDDLLSTNTMLFQFQLDVVAETIDGQNGAHSIYTREATAQWSMVGDGNFNAAMGTWAPAGTAGVTVPVPNAWTPVADGTTPGTVDQKTAINALLKTETFR